MNDNAKRWVEALRSGEYAQAKNALRSESGYCCLGVACALYAEDNPIEVRLGQDGTFSYDDDTALLPSAVQGWLGLNQPLAAFRDSQNNLRSLAGMNDDGKSFDAIADTIESEPKGLFA